MRSPLSSSTNSLPTASLRPDVGFDFVAKASVITFSFHRSDVSIPAASPQVRSAVTALRGRYRSTGSSEVRWSLFQKGCQCFLRFFRTNLHAECVILGLYCRPDLV